MKDKDQYQPILKPGDQIPIKNPYLNSPWDTENAVYLGANKFFAFPGGVLTTEGYAEWIAGMIGRKDQIPSDMEERKKYVLENSYFESYGRPRDRTVSTP